ncbi:MAG: AI-2E family transporter [Chloroflexales bacterium]|nr:AI-2E family transporter [Chloroflexales bacterium]
MTTTTPTTSTWWNSLRLRSVALGTLVVMLVVLGVALLVAIRDVLIAIFLGILLATALRPIMNGLRKLRLPRAVAALITVGLLVLAVAALIVAAVPPMAEQARTLTAEIPGFYERFRASLLASPYRIFRQFGASAPGGAPIDPNSYIASLLGNVFSMLPTIGYGLFITITTLLLTYYWLFQRDRSLRGVLLLLPSTRREALEQVWLQIEDKIGAFIRGQSILALVMAVLSLVGYWLIGMPYTLLLAVAAGVLELIPFLGPVITTVLAAAIGFSVSPQLGLLAIVVGLVVQQIENIFLVPRIMDQAVGVKPVVTLLALVGFAALFGLGGALLAIPLAAVGQVVFDDWLARSAADPTDGEVQGRTLISRLRYQVKDLAQDVRLRLRNKDTPAEDHADDNEEAIERVMAELDGLLKEAEEVTA